MNDVLGTRSLQWRRHWFRPFSACFCCSSALVLLLWPQFSCLQKGSINPNGILGCGAAMRSCREICLAQIAQGQVKLTFRLCSSLEEGGIGPFWTTSLGLSCSHMEHNWTSILPCPQSPPWPGSPGPPRCLSSPPSLRCFSCPHGNSTCTSINTALHGIPSHADPAYISSEKS